MRIGFDVSPITPGRTGVGNYCYYLLKNLLALSLKCEFYGYSTGRQAPDLSAFPHLSGARHIPVPTRVMYRAWEYFGRPRVDRLLGSVDVCHGTNYVTPPTAAARRVVTVHDLAFLTVPQYCSPKIVGPFARRIGAYCREADAIMAYSESTKRDIVNELQIEPEKIAVAPMAVDEGFAPLERSAAESYLRDEFGIEGPYFLFVSTLEPRKNVVGLLQSFGRLAKLLPHKLVLVGSMGWLMESAFHDAIAALNIGDRIVRPGFVPHQQLPAFYCAAEAFLFPTHYEGFGLPLLEALRCGCPVVSSDNSSVPEVTGDAALRVDAKDIDGFVDAVMRLVGDSQLRDDLVRKGFAHADRFSWRACAESTMATYEKVAG